MSDGVNVTKAGDILEVTIDRPKANAIDLAASRRLNDVFTSFRDDASLKIAITLAFIGSVISETVASNKGIGYLMLSASSRFEVPLVFAGLLVVGAMGIGMYAICVFFEKRMTRWAFRGQDMSS